MSVSTIEGLRSRRKVLLDEMREIQASAESASTNTICAQRSTQIFMSVFLVNLREES